MPTPDEIAQRRANAKRAEDMGIVADSMDVRMALIQQFLRHTEARTTERYARARASNLVELVKRGE